MDLRAGDCARRPFRRYQRKCCSFSFTLLCSGKKGGRNGGEKRERPGCGLQTDRASSWAPTSCLYSCLIGQKQRTSLCSQGMSRNTGAGQETGLVPLRSWSGFPSSLLSFLSVYLLCPANRWPLAHFCPLLPSYLLLPISQWVMVLVMTFDLLFKAQTGRTQRIIYH